MSKGTKQIRLGKVERFVKKLERQLVDLDELLNSNDVGAQYIAKKEGENKALEMVIRMMKEEFDLEGTN